MTQKQRIEELERKVIELEARLAVQEARPYYAYWMVQPNNNWPQYPNYQTWCFSNSSNGYLPGLDEV